MTIKDAFLGTMCGNDIVEYLENMEIRLGIKLTNAQLKVCQDYSITLGFAALDYKKDSDKYYSQHIGLEEALKLKEPCFLHTYLNTVFMHTTTDALFLSRYIAVSTPESIRNVLKNDEASDKKRASLERIHEEYMKVYHFAKWFPIDVVDIDNVWRAAWYVMHGYDKIGSIQKFTTKQLKKALELHEAIDRYAQIEHRDYTDILNKQADLLTYINNKLPKVYDSITIHAFETSEELAEEGMRMGNCIGTYWDHDANSCLFYVEADGEHMDVELMRDACNTDYDIWEVSQVFLAKNQTNEISEKLMDRLEVIVGAFNIVTKNAWLEKVKSKKRISCNDVTCDACTYQYVCGFSIACKLGSPRYDCDFEFAAKDEAEFKAYLKSITEDEELDEDLDTDVEDFDFEAYFADLPDDELAF
jgi:hypothetical protein